MGASYFSSGEARLVLPTPVFLGLAAILCRAQYTVVTTTCEKWPTRIKQLISLPLLMLHLILPLCVAGRDYALNVIVGLVFFNAFLRYVEIIFVGPVLQNRPAQIDPDRLHVELWSCLRRFPKTEKESKQKKRWYHLVPPMLVQMLLSNLLGSWYATFDGQDAYRLQQDRPFLFFVFFAFAVVVMTTVINASGYLLQIIYSLCYLEGWYDPDEWRLLMEYPMFASSMDDLWSHRWHQLMKPIWLAIPFRPVRMLLAGFSDDLARIMATLSVFFVSGLMHEYLVLCGAGWSAYRRLFMGQQCAFFMSHGLCVVFEKWIQQRYRRRIDGSLLGYVWVIGFSFYTFPWFLNGFAYWNLWHIIPYNALTPYLMENFWRKYPALKPFCGSLL